jgi:hypothetical protein
MCCDIFPALLRDPLGWTKWRSTSEGGNSYPCSAARRLAGRSPRAQQTTIRDRVSKQPLA